MNEDPLARKLGRLTPDSSSLDRDTLLVRLGQASARRGRFWPMAAAALAASQAITLYLLLTQRPEPAPRDGEFAAPRLQIVPQRVPGPDASPNDPQLWSYRKVMQSGNLEDLPTEKGLDYSPAPEKVLTAYSTRSILDLE